MEPVTAGLKPAFELRNSSPGRQGGTSLLSDGQGSAPLELDLEGAADRGSFPAGITGILTVGQPSKASAFLSRRFLLKSMQPYLAGQHVASLGGVGRRLERHPQKPGPWGMNDSGSCRGEAGKGRC